MYEWCVCVCVCKCGRIFAASNIKIYRSDSEEINFFNQIPKYIMFTTGMYIYAYTIAYTILHIV